MNTIRIQKIGITDLSTDAIVNAANDRLQAGSGVCGAVFRDAGYAKLQAACDEIGYCKTGSAVITPGFNLKAKYIIHAVGPIWNGGEYGEPKQLYGAYYRSLELAVENHCHSIGFPLISAGIFGYPKDQAWRKAIQACTDFFAKNPDADLEVVFAVLDDEIIRIGEKELERQWNKGNGNEIRKEKTGCDPAKEDFVFFWMDNEENGCFSQWYQAKMVIDGVEYANCEQYMMAKKALAMGDIEYYILIMHETDPAKVKQYGREVRGFDSAKWASCAPKIIYDGNYAKFTQNEELKRRLLATGDAVLAEASPYDKIYGIGLSADDPVAKVPEQWKGKNLMGKTLMKIREELQKCSK